MIKCKDCAFWEATNGGRGRCHYNPPNATLIPAQGLSGQGLSVVSYYPECGENDGCSKAMYGEGSIAKPTFLNAG